MFNQKLFIILIFIFAIQIPLFSKSHISYIEGIVIIKRGSTEVEGDFGSILLEGDIIQSGPDSLAIL